MNDGSFPKAQARDYLINWEQLLKIIYKLK
jgi:hypothetical protein